MCALAHGGQSTYNLGAVPQEPSALFLETRWGLGIPIRLGWLTSNPRDPPLSALPELGIPVYATWLFVLFCF